MTDERNDGGWRSHFEALGFIALVVGLALVVYELQLARSLSISERLSSGAANEIEVKAAVAEHADVWLRGCRGDELLLEEQVVFTQLVRAYSFNNFMKWRIAGHGVSDAANESIFPDSVARNIHRFEGFARSYSTLPLLDPDWEDVVAERVAHLRVAEPNPNAPLATCGT